MMSVDANGVSAHSCGVSGSGKRATVLFPLSPKKHSVPPLKLISQLNIPNGCSPDDAVDPFHGRERELTVTCVAEAMAFFTAADMGEHPQLPTPPPQHAQSTARRPPSVLILMAPDDVRPRVMGEEF